MQAVSVPRYRFKRPQDVLVSQAPSPTSSIFIKRDSIDETPFGAVEGFLRNELPLRVDIN